jgi:hypothetical protein
VTKPHRFCLGSAASERETVDPKTITTVTMTTLRHNAVSSQSSSTCGGSIKIPRTRRRHMAQALINTILDAAATISDVTDPVLKPHNTKAHKSCWYKLNAVLNQRMGMNVEIDSPSSVARVSDTRIFGWPVLRDVPVIKYLKQPCPVLSLTKHNRPDSQTADSLFIKPSQVHRRSLVLILYPPAAAATPRRYNPILASTSSTAEVI